MEQKINFDSPVKGSQNDFTKKSLICTYKRFINHFLQNFWLWVKYALWNVKVLTRVRNIRCFIVLLGFPSTLNHKDVHLNQVLISTPISAGIWTSCDIS